MKYYSLLASFLTCYQFGSTAKAAKELNITQSSVSKHLQSLDTNFNKRLFTRSPYGLTPTAAADELASVIGPEFDNINLQISLFKSDPNSKQICTHKIIIASSSDIITLALGEIFFPLIKEGYTFEFKSINRPSLLIDLLNNREVDIAVYPDISEFESTPLWQVEEALIGHKHWLTKIDQSKSHQNLLEDIEKLPWAVYNEENKGINNFMSTVYGEKIIPKQALVVNNYNALTQAVMSHKCAAILPYKLFKIINKKNPDIIELIIPNERPQREIQLAVPQNAIQEPAVHYVYEYIQHFQPEENFIFRI